MNVKLLEVRDRATFIPVIAIAMLPYGWDDLGLSTSEMKACFDARRYLLRRCGYAEDERHPTILLTAADGGRKAEADVYAWGDRTYQVAHDYITKHWHDLKDGDVVDVEHVLGETKEPKRSEREEGAAMKPETMALVMARLSMAGSAVAVLLATLAARKGHWGLWAINGALFLACAACAAFNYRQYYFWRRQP